MDSFATLVAIHVKIADSHGLEVCDASSLDLHLEQLDVMGHGTVPSPGWFVYEYTMRQLIVLFDTQSMVP